MTSIEETAMSSLPEPYFTPEEYLEGERKAETKSEYLDGHIYDMAGATRAHNLVAGNIFGEIRSQLKGRTCEAYIGDMKVRVPSSRLYTYPDVAVACGEIQFEDDETDVLLNPVVLIEVLSPSTEAYDRGRKFERYREIESLQEYILIAQDRVSVEHYLRRGGEWAFKSYLDRNDRIALPSIDCAILLSEIYLGLEFGEE
jgi:Uma2 family endonuclease